MTTLDDYTGDGFLTSVIWITDLAGRREHGVTFTQTALAQARGGIYKSICGAPFCDTASRV